MTLLLSWGYLMVSHTYLILASVFVLIYSLLFAFYPFWKRASVPNKQPFPSGEALASGIFLGAGLLHMLPEGAVAFKELGIQFPMAAFIAGVMFLFLLLLEHIGKEYYHHRGSDVGFVLLAVLMFSIHALLAGMALGIHLEFSFFVAMLVAILAHKWAESFALAVQLAGVEGISIRGSMGLYAVYALMTPIGMLYASWLDVSGGIPVLFEASVNALSAGTFIYLGTLHGLSRAVMIQRCCNAREYIFVIVGFMVMALLKVVWQF